jgi:hypothetical protein
MLVDNKFIYLSLPRCASTAFHYSCLMNNIEVKTTNNMCDASNVDIDFQSIEKVDVMNHIFHGHEDINILQSKFGIDKPVIAVRREKYERFYSLYKHILSDFKRLGYLDFYDVFSKFTIDELFFFTKEDLINRKTRWDIILDYLIDLKLINKRVDINLNLSTIKYEEQRNRINNWYIVNVIEILLTPISFWTNHNPNIIWFEFDKLNELDKWVSNIIGKPFEMQKVNSSKHIECNVILDNTFIEKYNGIFDYYDLPKFKNTLI